MPDTQNPQTDATAKPQAKEKNVELLQLAVFGFQQLVTQAPQLWNEFAALFQKKDPPTEAEWLVLREKIKGKSYFDYVPQSDLPRP